MNQHNHFDREYSYAIKTACLKAIANTSYATRGEQDRTIPADEVYHALIDIMGTIAATEDSLPNDLNRWAQALADKFAKSFHAARLALGDDHLAPLHSH